MSRARAPRYAARIMRRRDRQRAFDASLWLDHTHPAMTHTPESPGRSAVPDFHWLRAAFWIQPANHLAEAIKHDQMKGTTP